MRDDSAVLSDAIDLRTRVEQARASTRRSCGPTVVDRLKPIDVRLDQLLALLEEAQGDSQIEPAMLATMQASVRQLARAYVHFCVVTRSALLVTPLHVVARGSGAEAAAVPSLQAGRGEP